MQQFILQEGFRGGNGHVKVDIYISIYVFKNQGFFLIYLFQVSKEHYRKLNKNKCKILLLRNYSMEFLKYV